MRFHSEMYPISFNTPIWVNWLRGTTGGWVQLGWSSCNLGGRVDCSKGSAQNIVPSMGWTVGGSSIWVKGSDYCQVSESWHHERAMGMLASCWSGNIFLRANVGSRSNYSSLTIHLGIMPGTIIIIISLCNSLWKLRVLFHLQSRALSSLFEEGRKKVVSLSVFICWLLSTVHLGRHDTTGAEGSCPLHSGVPEPL